jgi:hypothetical protein
MPLSLLNSAFLGHEVTQGAFSHRIQAIAMFSKVGLSTRTVRILERRGLNPFSLIAEHANSHNRQPVHFSGSETTYLRSICHLRS